MNKVLLIDSAENLRAYTAPLREEGFELTGATTGDQALALAEANPPDVVVLEVDLPGGMDGYEIIGRLLGRHSDLPVILHTSSPKGLTSNFACTAADCVEKSNDIGPLVACLRRILRWKEKLVHGAATSGIEL